MDGELYSNLFSGFGDLAHKLNQVLAQAIDGDVAVFIELALEAGAVIDGFSGGHPVDQIALELRELAFGPGGEALRRYGDALGRVIGFGVAALQDQHVIGAEIDDVETQRRAAVGQRPVEIGAGPVGDGHEIITANLDAGAGHGAERLLVVVDLAAEVACAGFDRLRHGDAFDHVPGEACGFDDGLAFQNFVAAPGLAAIHVMECRDDAHRSGLLYVREGDRVVRSEPAPGLLHDACFMDANSGSLRRSSDCRGG